MEQGHRRLGERLSLWLRGSRPRLLARVGGVVLVLLAGLAARRQPEAGDFSSPFWLWLIGVPWFLLSFVPPFSLKGAWLRARQQCRTCWVELVGLVVVLLVAFFVRAVDLEHIPANLGGDEGIWGMEGMAMLDGRLANPFATRWFAFPSMSFLAWGLAMRVFGDTVAGLRTLSVLLGTASVLTTFLLARELWGRRIAWPAALLLTFSHYHIHYSRLAYNNIADDLFVTLALWMLVRGLRSRHEVYFAVAGAVIGLGWYGYFGARLIGILVALYLAWRTVVERHLLARYAQWALLMMGAALLVAAPLLLYYAGHPGSLTARSRQVSIFASGWLEREQIITGRSAASLLLEQFWKAVSAFNYTLDPTFIYRPSIPLLDMVSAVLFIVGLLWTTAHCRRPANGLLLMWFWLAVTLGWVVTENPPASQRIIIVAPALASLVSLGLDWLVRLGRRLSDGERRLWGGAVVGLLVVVAVANLHYYFVVYTPTRVYGNPTAEIATALSRYLARQDGDCVVYFYASPVMYWDFGTLRFMARGVEGMDVHPPGESEPPQLDLTRGARFVFLPHRLEELETIRARYPGGAETPAYSEADGRLLYVLYEVSP